MPYNDMQNYIKNNIEDKFFYLSKDLSPIIEQAKKLGDQDLLDQLLNLQSTIASHWSELGKSIEKRKNIETLHKKICESEDIISED